MTSAEELREYKREWARAWRAANPELALEKNRRYRLAPEAAAEYRSRRYWADPAAARQRAKDERVRTGRRWRNHHITAEIAENIWFDQECACAGCGVAAIRPDVLHVDHDHACCSGVYSCGRCIRGLACRACNINDQLAGSPRLDLALVS